eukprot:SAG22_NODE_20889_length_262_cov_0.380368_1_plen_25_part_01
MALRPLEVNIGIAPTTSLVPAWCDR